MDQARASVTAIVTSLMRAAHSRLDDAPLIDDRWGERLVSDAEREAILALGLQRLDPGERTAIEALDSDEARLAALLRNNSAYGTVIVRTRYAEDALAAAVARGARQYVIIGAGMDSFALRRPDFARELEIFEVDHPASQALKRARAGEPGEGHRLVAADLSSEPLAEALDRAGFQSGERSFFSWLGVTSYLTRAANLATLRAIAACGGAGSEVVFTYLDQRRLDDEDDAEMQRGRAAVASVGEPWVSGFDPAELAGALRGAGLELVESLGGAQLAERYCAAREDGLAPAPWLHVALARVS